MFGKFRAFDKSKTIDLAIDNIGPSFYRVGKHLNKIKQNYSELERTDIEFSVNLYSALLNSFKNYLKSKDDILFKDFIELLVAYSCLSTYSKRNDESFNKSYIKKKTQDYLVMIYDKSEVFLALEMPEIEQFELKFLEFKI